MSTKPNGSETPRGEADSDRRRLMLACARATDGELEAAVAGFGDADAARDVRAPETGLVMMRGRIGGTGAPFNFGEMSVTRAVVQLSDQSIGFGYQMGRSHVRARLAAVVDALGQDPVRRAQLEDVFVQPVLARAAADDANVQAESAATRVNFFTMTRGEDADT
ncbi:MAG: phosphonate C-P lyase system protein PhnG [Pseudomonadota bacterium]